MENEREVLLEVNHLNVTYGSGKKAYEAVQDANFKIYKGEDLRPCRRKRQRQNYHWPGHPAHSAHLGRRDSL